MPKSHTAVQFTATLQPVPHGGLYLGVHKATAQRAGVGPGVVVAVTIARDAAPLPTDTVPADLARALGRVSSAAAAWKQLSPVRRREYVKGVLEAKQRQTRGRRITKIVETLRAGVPPRRTWHGK